METELNTEPYAMLQTRIALKILTQDLHVGAFHYLKEAACNFITMIFSHCFECVSRPHEIEVLLHSVCPSSVGDVEYL